MQERRTYTYLFYIRWILGLLLLIPGIAFLFIPFIPLGYVLIISSLVILGPQLPFYRKAMNWIIERDQSNNVRRIEKKLTLLEQRIENQIAAWLKNE